MLQTDQLAYLWSPITDSAYLFYFPIAENVTSYTISSCYDLILVLTWAGLHRLTGRVLEYLWQQVESEGNVWQQDDLRIAYTLVYLLSEDHSFPYEEAFNRVVGGFPSRVVPRLLSAHQELKAKLGPSLADELIPDYDYQVSAVSPQTPKKPAAPATTSSGDRGAGSKRRTA